MRVRTSPVGAILAVSGVTVWIEPDPRRHPLLLEVDDPDELFDGDSPDDLLQAAAIMDRRRLSVPY